MVMARAMKQLYYSAGLVALAISDLEKESL